MVTAQPKYLKPTPVAPIIPGLPPQIIIPNPGDYRLLAGPAIALVSRRP
jgi:hypothetical protein